jgi:hypothetical protein
MGLKVKGLFFDKSVYFFAHLSHLMEQNGRLIVQHGVDQVVCDLFEFCLEGLELDFFFVHAYRIPQNAQNTRDFFTISETIFVDVLANERLNFAL